MSAPKSITLTDQDARRLSSLVSLYALRRSETDAVSSLAEELERAVIVPPSSVGSSIVTMSSRIACRDEAGALRELQVVYPRQADASAGRISVLAPLGRALLGAAVGDRVKVVVGGKARTWRIEAIVYQPEAAGDYHL
jgi:regulator of nucleoside diphosphate kinase